MHKAATGGNTEQLVAPRTFLGSQSVPAPPPPPIAEVPQVAGREKELEVPLRGSVAMGTASKAPPPPQPLSLPSNASPLQVATASMMAWAAEVQRLQQRQVVVIHTARPHRAGLEVITVRLGQQQLQ